MRWRFFMTVVVGGVGALSLGATAFAARTCAATHGGKPFNVALAPQSGVASNGSGSALVTLNQGQGEVCFDITVENLTTPVVLAHIHAGGPGVNGPIGVGLMCPAQWRSGCEHADRALDSW